MSTTKETGTGEGATVGQPSTQITYAACTLAGHRREGGMGVGGGRRRRGMELIMEEKEEVLRTGLRRRVTQHQHSYSLPNASCFPISTTEGWVGWSKFSFRVTSVDEQRKTQISTV